MTDWYQQALTPPEVLELRLRIGLVPERDHAQAMVELVDPITSVQVAQWSAPHVHLDGWMTLLEEATRKAHQYIADHLEPF